MSDATNVPAASPGGARRKPIRVSEFRKRADGIEELRESNPEAYAVAMTSAQAAWRNAASVVAPDLRSFASGIAGTVGKSAIADINKVIAAGFRETLAMIAANSTRNDLHRRTALVPWLHACSAAAAAVVPLAAQANDRMHSISKTVTDLVADTKTVDKGYGVTEILVDPKPLGKELGRVYDWAWQIGIDISDKPPRGYQLPELPPARVEPPDNQPSTNHVTT